MGGIAAVKRRGFCLIKAPGTIHTPTAWGLPLGLLTALVVCLPSTFLIVSSLSSASRDAWANVFSKPFIGALERSAQQIGWVAVISLSLGVPYGMACRLLRFPFKSICYVLLLLPLIIPQFLWAIGIQSLKPFVRYSWQHYLDGGYGAVLAYSTMVMPIVAFGTILAGWQITQSARDAAFLAGGAASVIKNVLRYILPGAVGMGVVGCLITLGDPGTGQIMGFHGVASEVLTAFAARADFQMAALKAVTTTLLALPLMIVGIVAIDPYLDCGTFGSGGRGRHQPQKRKLSFGTLALGIAMILVAAVLLLPAWAGLLRPLLGVGPSRRELAAAFSLWWESIPVTLAYCGGAGCAATILGFLLAVSATQAPVMRRVILIGGLLFMSMPPSVHGLGMVMLLTNIRAVLHLSFVSDFLVGAGLGIRFVPVSAAILFVALKDLSPDLYNAARIHSVPTIAYCTRVLLPILSFPILLSFGSVALLALADVSTTLLLQQPGRSSFGAHLFAVMDNSSEKTVAALCLAYLVLPVACIVLWSTLARVPAAFRAASTA